MSATRSPAVPLPGLNALARGLAASDPAVAPFLPDRPELDVIARRCREVLASFRARRIGQDVPDAEMATGRAAAVATGQQAGLFTGPVLTLVKALAALDLASALGARGEKARAAFWCSSDDHDLVEVTRVVVPGPDGQRDLSPDPSPLVSNRRPVGDLPIDGAVDVDALLSAASEGLPNADAESRTALRDLNAGITFRDGFVATLRWLLGDVMPIVEGRGPDHERDLVPLASRLVTERAEVKRLLDERAAQLTSAGYVLQVTTDAAALPLFAVVDGERRLLVDHGGDRLGLKGEDGTFAVAEVVERFESGAWRPSFSALSRPLAASTLYPVAATVLGPAEVAYWAQLLPLFPWAGLTRPVIVPRPSVALVGPASRRLMEKLGLSLADVLAGADALLTKQGAGRAGALLGVVHGARDSTAATLEALRGELAGVDPSLGKALDTTLEKVRFALDKLAEKTAAAAGRADETVARQIARLADEIAPGGVPAERVYTPLPWLLRFGREPFVDALRGAVAWDRFGVTAVDLT